MKRTKRNTAVAAIVFDDDGMLYVVVDGRRIARRGPRTRWVSLEPGWTVCGIEPGVSDDTITIVYDSKSARPQ